ncbi:hypothetical protein [Streptomyces nigrescens]|uniref:hypothetical protein n=1 Tax=Streptomyces nigrescens TaxID=1920 RepID=UPI0036F4BDE5
MAKSDRNAAARATVTGENNAQALSWIRKNGVTHGLAPDAASSEQQLLEAALLAALAHPHQPLVPHAPRGCLFGIAKASPGAGGDLPLWPRAGDEAAVLARLLPSRSSEGICGVPGLRWSLRSDKFLALAGPRGAASVLLASQPRDVRAAARILADVGLRPLWDESVSTAEETAWAALVAALATDAPGWSRALRRPLLAQRLASTWSTRAPGLADVAGDEAALMPRAHGPVSRLPRVVHVRSLRGGTGCTTMSVQIAYGMARTGRAVALVADDVALRQVAGEAADETAVWHEPLVPVSAGRLSAASHGSFGEDLPQRALEAGEHGEVVVLDVGTWPVAELPPADLTVVIDQYKAHDWIQIDVTDRRPEHIRVFAALDERFAAWQRGLPAPTGADKLLAALDREFLAYTTFRLEDPDDTEVYDSTDPEDVEEWWDLFTGTPGHLEDLLPPEDAAPLDVWRRELLDAITAEGQRRYPDHWAAVRDSWIEHNRLRNLQRLGTRGDTIGEVADQVCRFLDSDRDLQPRASTADERRTWCASRLMQWLDERFDAHLQADAAHLPRSDSETLLAVLDARFLAYCHREANSGTMAPGGASDDAWWDAAAALRGLEDGDYGLLPDRDEGAVDEWRTAFLQSVDAEGARRHPGLWPEVRARWVAHNRQREQAGLAPFEPAPDEHPGLRALFAGSLDAMAAEAVGPQWAELSGRWVAGERNEARRVGDFADLIERRQRPGTGEEIADALMHNVGALDLDPQMPRVVVTNLYRPMGGPSPITAASSELSRRGVLGLCAVPQHKPLERRRFEPSSWNDDRVKPLQEELGALVRNALKSADRTRAVRPR